MPAMNKWELTTDPLMLRRLGKLGEELGELASVASRCIIQGVDATDPGTGKVNRQRLLDELADVAAQIDCTMTAFGLDTTYFGKRRTTKREQMAEWEALYRPSGVPVVQPQQEKNVELPDAIRVPLDELEADAAYIIGRVAVDGSCSGIMVEAIRKRTRAIREALLAHGAQGSSARDHNEVMALVYLYGSHCAEHPEDAAGQQERLAGVKTALGVAGTPAPSNTRVLDVGFKFEGGAEYTPTVLVGFALNDWEARDAFVRALTSGVADTLNDQPKETK